MRQRRIGKTGYEAVAIMQARDDLLNTIIMFDQIYPSINEETKREKSFVKSCVDRLRKYSHFTPLPKYLSW